MYSAEIWNDEGFHEYAVRLEIKGVQLHVPILVFVINISALNKNLTTLIDLRFSWMGQIFYHAGSDLKRPKSCKTKQIVI